jgi:tRNA(fMet)-specific endonuclease VapC
MTRFLLDTNVVSEALRPRPHAGCIARMTQESDACAIAAITWHELRYGALRMPAGRRRDVVLAYLEEVVRPSWPILSYDERAADWHGRERARMSALGRSPPFADGQIAAIARTNGLILVTANLTDFHPFEGVEAVSWTSD